MINQKKIDVNNITTNEARNFSKKIIEWHEKHGRHDLPWQKQRTAYRVWISEIMLQQTQVKTVIEYYKKFMQRFPGLKQLAAATEDEVLHYWTGLGYYARARNLHRCAQQIINEHNGRFPGDIEQVMALPGIGRSTAGAILSLSKKQRHPILDGNVKRVLCRYWMVEGWPEKTTVKNKLWQLADKLTPEANVDRYTQAMMDLGATVCTRTQPACERCPVKRQCQARLNSQVTRFPFAKPKAKIPIKSTHMLIIRNKNNEVYLQKRPPSGIWGGLWSLPECPLEQNIHDWCVEKLGLQVKTLGKKPALRHTFSHFHLDITPVNLKFNGYHSKVMESMESVWYNQDSKMKLGFAAPVKRLLSEGFSVS